MAIPATSKGFFAKQVEYWRDKSIQNPHITKSFLLHFVILLGLTGIIPTCSRKIEAPKVISVSIMPMGASDKTSPKASPNKTETKTDQVPTPEPKPPVKKPQEATKMEKSDKPQPIEKVEQKKPAPKKVEKKPEPKKEVKTQDAQKRDDRDQDGKKKLLKDLEKKDQAALDNIFDDVAKDEKPTTAKTAEASGKTAADDAAIANQIMSIFQSQVYQCWNIPIGAKDIANMEVNLNIKLNQQGTVTDVQIMDQARYSSDNTFRVVADSAVWAVKECSPFHDLPADKFSTWSEIQFAFDPSKAL